MMMVTERRCEDCGNQAKKECVYMRCRTCCKTKGFHCQTHIKSTWVPAYRRSHKHQTQTQPLPIASNPKRLRELQPFSNSSPIPSGVQIRTTPTHFPAELNCPADFRCVKVSSIDDTKEQYAYQTTVNIGGHVFRGILHDQGLDKVMVDPLYNCNNIHNQEARVTSSFNFFMSLDDD